MCKTPLFPSGYSCSLLFFWLHASGHPGIHQTCAIHFLFAVSYLVNHAFYMASGLPGTHQTCAKHPFFPSGYSCSLLFFWLHASGHPGIHQTCAIHFLFAVSYLINHAFYMASGLPHTPNMCKTPLFPSGYSCSLLFFWLHASGHPGIHQTCATHCIS